MKMLNFRQNSESAQTNFQLIRSISMSFFTHNMEHKQRSFVLYALQHSKPLNGGQNVSELVGPMDIVD
jgi:hypothetical protein